MNIYIETIIGEKIKFDVFCEDKIELLKMRFGDKENIPLHLIRLDFNGITLEDEKTLMDYDIKDEDVINWVLRVGSR